MDVTTNRVTDSTLQAQRAGIYIASVIKMARPTVPSSEESDTMLVFRSQIRTSKVLARILARIIYIEQYRNIVDQSRTYFARQISATVVWLNAVLGTHTF